MTIARRAFLRLAAGAAALPALPHVGHAQAYPSRPIRLLIGFSAGGSADIAARLIAQWLSERLGQPVIVENKVGAASNLAAETVARAEPDGHTLLFVLTVNAINATYYQNLKFDFIRDFEAIAGGAEVPNILNVNPSIPARTVPEFIAYAKANPGKLNMASSGNGTSIHLAGEMFQSLTGTKLVHVPYRSPPQAMTDLIAGQVQVMFDVMTQSIGHVRAGRLRALAVTSAARSPLFPDLPTVSESVPGYEASSWQGFCAPKGTPREIIERLNREIVAGLNHPPIREKLLAGGGTPITLSSTAFAKFLADETEKWGKLVRALGIKAE